MDGHDDTSGAVRPWRLSDFDYSLPEDRIAQRPAARREASRLLVSRPEGVEDRRFGDLETLLEPGDLLVLNDTRVLPARLLGCKADSGGRVEIFLLRALDGGHRWEALIRASKPPKPGALIRIGEGEGEGFVAVGPRRGPGTYEATLPEGGSWAELLERHGRMPLPPYITASDPEEDRERYQTVYARNPGAVAAPTAGLHFTPELLARLEARGIGSTRVTLHVGLGTFQPVREEDLSRHVMHREWYRLPAESAERIAETRRRGGRIVAVGTTAVRVLESAAAPDGTLVPGEGETNLFILPGYRFKGVDRMITNFHLPKSTLLMLVAAFVGKGRMERDYAHALASDYRFFSYGDAQFLVK
ncbi:MAG: tRNA preQ1(34) S-adenosylmethionine ribosyltransferase-isomerase QueA [Magnetococcales bacterium]|nr:tRNA preQ1(34) S-adenosylmethionine ribosyltransferase-isomerase QueA [Magnetococcales bacterium]